MYLETRSGWFSDRTQCYLASGRPALVRDTGFGDAIPTGDGLLAFEDADGIIEGVERIGSDYARHSRRARALAEEHFGSDRVLTELLERVAVAA
jgi:hypothetical protein